MSARQKPSAGEELERIEDAVVESILDATGEDLRKEIITSGGDPDAILASIDRVILSARSQAARKRLERARAELSAWRAKSEPVSPPEREAARTRFERLRSGNSDPEAKMMMAARKGEGLSESDAKGLIDDIAELKRLEKEKGDG